MKITLITPTPPDISSFDVRALSAYVRAQGHQSRIVFLPGSIGLLKSGEDVIYQYPQRLLDQLVDLIDGSDVVGLSFMTNYFDRALQITEHFRKTTGIPIIWGGVHPSSKPDEALEYADMVGIGEGELTLVELLDRMAEGQDYTDIRGMWFRRGDTIIKNEHRPLIADLDSLPPFDFSNTDHYVIDNRSGDIVPLTDDLLRDILPLLPHFNGQLKRAFRTMTDRGCPHKCTYCSVSNIKEMFAGDHIPYLRFRSVPRVIDELVSVRERFPFVEAFQFFDDTFFARPYKQILDFSEQYRKRVGLPFHVQASPNTLSERKLVPLMDAGLVYVEFGIQTGSQRIKEMYRRTESNDQIVAAAELLHKSRGRLLDPDYHVIVDNPWETEENTMETVKLLYRLPKPFGLAVSNLVFFPHTPLYDKAVAEGLISDEQQDVYRKPFYQPRATYPNFLVNLFSFQHIPRWIYRILISDRAVKLLSKDYLSGPLGLITRMGESLRFLSKGFGAVVRGDWRRIGLYFKRWQLVDPGVTGRKH